MSSLIESRKINDKFLIYVFEFDQIRLYADETDRHYFTLDKWLSLDNWIEIFNSLESVISTYTETNEISTDKTISIENGKLAATSSWIKLNSTIKDVANLRSQNTYKHYIQVKVKIVSKFDQIIRKLQKEIKKLKNLNSNSNSNETIESPIILSVDSSSKKEVFQSKSTKLDEINLLSTSNASTEESTSQDDISQDEEYVPEVLKDYMSPELNVVYEPSKISPINSRNQEYTPSSSANSSIEDINSKSVYYPGGSHYIHEPYDPDTSVKQKKKRKSEERKSRNENLILIDDSQKSENNTKTPSKSKKSDNEMVKGNSMVKKKRETLLKCEQTKEECKRNRNLFEQFADNDSGKCSSPRKKAKVQRYESDDLFGNSDEGDEMIKDDDKEHVARAGLSRKAKTYKSLRETDIYKESIQRKTAKDLESKTPKVKKKSNLHGENEGNITKWLSKRNPSEIAESKEKLKSKSSKAKLVKELNVEENVVSAVHHVPIHQRILNDEEMAEFNAKHEKEMKSLTDYIEKVNQCNPELPNVEILHLKDMPMDEFTGTYSKYKQKILGFVNSYVNRKEAKFNAPSDINNLISGELLTSKQQLHVMEYLENKFSKDDNLTGLAELFWDVVLPEWALSVFIEKYHFTRQQALGRIQLQEKIAADSIDNSF